MSREIDERVVSMQFDNQHFERNVQTSLSTLDKLKQKLNLTGASKGLENVGAAAKKIDVSPLGHAVETVGTKFSALEVMGVTALANITNSAVNAGKRIVSALTIDPVKTGFQEYETQINAVQTILANTSSKGTTIDDVNKALDELNKYADQTIYNFTEMTRNIGTFTAAGVDLDTSVSAIQGIANLAAVSGSTSQQASTAMYQLSQALAAGRVSLMDWNSVVNAGMGGEVFQNALRRTSEVMGTGAEAAIKKYGSFRESLTQGEWLTTDVLTETLNQFTMAAKEGTDQWEKYKASLMEKGYTEDQATEILKMANTATNAATKVKTFTQLWDVMKESAQSGWSQTWKLIIGDFEEAKSLLTPLSEFMTGIINKMSDWRNGIIESALGKNFSKLAKDIKGFSEPISKTVDTVKDAVDTVKDLGAIVDKVINGDFGNGQIRFDALTKAGYNWCEVQNKVNEKLGDGHRYTQEQIEAQNKLLGTQNKTTEAAAESTKAQEELSKENIKRLATLTEMSDAELESLGYTKEQIKAFKELAEVSHKLGIPIEELIENIDEIDGRWLLFEGLKNIGKSLVDIFKTLSAAWTEVFGPMKKVEEIGASIFNMLAAFHKFTRSLVIIDDETGKLTETGDKLLRTFKGVFTVVRLVANIFGGALKIAFTVVRKVLEYFDMDILDLTAKIGDILVEFGKWVDQLFDLDGIIKVVVPYIAKAAKAVANFLDKVKESDALANFVQGIRDTIGSVTDWIAGIKDAENIPKYIISGLVNGLKGGAAAVWNAGLELAKGIYEAVCNFLGIHSPSKLFFAIGGFIIAGLVAGILSGDNAIGNAVRWLGEKITEFFGGSEIGEKAKNVFIAVKDGLQNGFQVVKDFLSGIDWGGLVTVGIIAGLLKVAWDISSAIKNLSAGFEGFGDLAEQIGDATKRVSKAAKNFLNAKALQSLATSLLMLVGAIVVLTLIPAGKVWMAIGQIAALAVILGTLAAVVGKFGSSEGNDFGKISLILLAVSGALLIAAGAMKILGGMDPGAFKQGLIAIGALSAIIVVLTGVAAFAGKKADGIAGSILKIAIAIGVVALVARMLAGLDDDAMSKGMAMMVFFTGIVAGLLGATRLAGNTDKIGRTILGIATAITMMALVFKMVSGMSWADIGKGALVVAGFAGIVVGLLAATNLVAGARSKNIGSAIAGIGAAIFMMAITLRIVSGMDETAILKGMACIIAFSGIIVGLIAATRLAGKSHKHLAKTLLAIAGAIAIMAAVAVLLGMVRTENLIKGIAAMAALSAMVALMIAATKGAQACVGNLVVITVAISLLAVAIGLLSQIDPTGLAAATIALSTVMGIFALVIKMSGNAAGSLATLIVLTTAVAAIGGIIYLLAGLPWQGTLAAAGALSAVLLSLSASMLIISRLATPGPLALVAIGIMTLVVAAIGGIIYLLAQMPVESVTGVVISLSTMLLTMTGVLAILTLIGTLGPAALIGVGSLMALIVGIGALIVGIGALVQKFPQLEEFLDTGIPILEKIGYALGSFFGNIIGGFAAGATSGLPEIATSLSTFMTNLTPFITGAKAIDQTAMDNIGSLVKAILLVTAADLVAQIASWVGAGNFAQLGADLSAFMVNAMPFIMGSRMIDATAMEGAKNLADVIMTLTKADLLSGVTSWITGGSSMSDFANQLVPFGQAMVAFSATVSGNIDAEAVNAAANAGSIMAKMAETLPNSGGVVGWFMGENDMDDFGAQLVPFGKAIVEFSKTVTGKIDAEAVQAAANAGKIMVEMANTLPNSGGVLGWFAGENDMDDFGAQLVPFGKAIAEFSKTVSGKIDAEAVTAAASAGKTLSELASNLPNSGGVVSWFKGDNDMDDFGVQLKGFGKGIAGFSKEVAGKVDSDGITTAANAAGKIVDMIGKTAGLDTSGVLAFKMAVKTLAEADIDGVIRAFKNSSKLSSAGVDLVKSIAKGVESGKKSLTTAVGEAITGALNKAKDQYKSFKEVGKALATRLREGIDSKASKIKSEFGDAVSDAKTKVRNYRDDFYDAGKYLASGLASGISANSYKVEAKARAMAKAAAEAAEDELDINSPSKVFRAIGTSIPEGFAQGIERLGYLVTSSSEDMGKVAVSSVSDSLSHMNDILLGDVESHPTIRPVVDLSGVKTGRDAIAELLSMGSDIGVLANVGAISTAMNRMNQNGGNEDVVSAINQLRKGLDNVGNTNYTVNGVTVTDSDVEEAIQTLIGAIIRDRRS